MSQENLMVSGNPNIKIIMLLFQKRDGHGLNPEWHPRSGSKQVAVTSTMYLTHHAHKQKLKLQHNSIQFKNQKDLANEVEVQQNETKIA